MHTTIIDFYVTKLLINFSSRHTGYEVFFGWKFRDVANFWVYILQVHSDIFFTLTRISYSLFYAATEKYKIPSEIARKKIWTESNEFVVVLSNLHNNSYLTANLYEKYGNDWQSSEWVRGIY